MPQTTDKNVAPPVGDDEVDAIIAEFGGDPKAAIRALLDDLTTLALDSAVAVSRGYVRGNLLPFRCRVIDDEKSG